MSEPQRNVSTSEPNDAKVFVEQCLSSTGYLCRELFGYNYDEDEGARKTNVGYGGIVDHGKHKEICDLLDDRTKEFKLILAPRESRKSSILQGFVVRQILLNPNIRICYIGRTDSIVLSKAQAIQRQLERQEVQELFGPQVGSPWSATEFSVAGVTDVGLQSATFTAFSMDSFRTGGRYNIVILDDFIDHKNVTTPEQNRKSKELYAQLQPFIARGGQIIVVGTIWDEDDLYNNLQGNPLFAPPKGGQIICGSGTRIVTTAEGKLDLEVVETGLTFPHLTLDYLRKKLYGMALEGKTGFFSMQYNNEVTSVSSAQFHRSYFQPLTWAADMHQLTGYLVTDTAYGEKDENCYSVIGYIGLDASDNIYVLDMEVGHWDPTDFTTRFFNMLERWHDKLNHAGECFERIALNVWARDSLEKDSRARKTRLRIIEMDRPPTSQKGARIMRLQPPMRNKHFYVVDTMPKSFVDVDGERVLWDPKGHWDARLKAFLPGGELVDEFVKANSKKDIADSIAMVLEYEKLKNGYRRLCSFKPWRPKPAPKALTEQRLEDYRRAEYHPSSASSDWWEQKLQEHGF